MPSVTSTARAGRSVKNLTNADLEFLRQELLARARTRMLGFAKYSKPDYQIGWHHRLLCDYLDRFVRREIKRLILTLPPRHGKSELGSRRLPAFIFGHNPNASIISTSYSADLASRMNRDVQRIIDSPEYREVFPDIWLSGSSSADASSGTTYLRNSDIFEIVGHSGVYRSAGVGGGITGMGADFLVIDDPIKNAQEADSLVYRQSLWDWYTSTLYTRLEKDGCILIILTRWHEDDLAGRLLSLAKSDPSADQWTVLNLEAIREDMTNPEDPRAAGDALWRGKYDEQALAKIKASVGSRVWTGLYQQRPSPGDGGELKRGWWKYWRSLPDRFEQTLISADLSFDDKKGSDYCVFQAWGKAGANRYFIDQVRGRMDFPTQLTTFKNFCAKHKTISTKVIEEKANGAALIATVKATIVGVIPFNPKTSKPVRVNAVSPAIEAGNVFLPDPTIAPWVNDFVEECSAFPNGAHDDQVDAMSQALLRWQDGAVGSWGDMAKTTAQTVVASITKQQW
jgi:predicted phage terminase large subunit-like protein